MFGLEIISRRKMSYEKIAPADARKLFILQGLIEQQLLTRCSFYAKNSQTLHDLKALEDRTRRQIVLVDESLVAAFYESRLPMDIMSANSLEQWAKYHDDSILLFSESDIGIDKSKAAWWEQHFPLQFVCDDKSYQLQYKFDLTAEDDGVTLQIPIDSLALLQDYDFSWLVEGLLTEKIATYLKALPKRLRVLLAPLPETISKAKASLNRQQSFDNALRAYLEEKLGMTLGPALWENVMLPAYLKMHFKVVGPQNILLAQGDRLSLLYEQLREKFTDKMTQNSPLEKKNIIGWDFDDLPERHVIHRNRLELIYFPALQDAGNSVSISLFETPVLARYHHCLGLARLYLLTLKEATTFIKKQIQANKKFFQQQNSPLGEYAVLTEELLLSAAVHTFPEINIRSKEAFMAQLTLHRQDLVTKANSLIAAAKEWISLDQQIEKLLKRLADKPSKEMQTVITDTENQLKNLFEQHFLTRVPLTTLLRYTTYLKGILMRLEKLPRLQMRDSEAMVTLDKVQKAYASKLASKKQIALDWDDPLILFRFKMEELRISLFAEKLGTQEPVSAVRLLKLLEKLG